MCPQCKAVRLSVDTNFLRTQLSDRSRSKNGRLYRFKYRTRKKRCEKIGLITRACPSHFRTYVIKRIRKRKERKRKREMEIANFSFQQKRFDPHFAFSLSPDTLYSRKISLNEIPTGWYNSRGSVAVWVLYNQRRSKCRQARCPGTALTM